MSQTYRGIRVLGGELIVHVDGDGLLGINGRFVAGLDLPAVAALAPTESAGAALEWIQREGGANVEVVDVLEPVIWGISGEPVVTVPVRAIWVEDGELVFEDVYVDAANRRVRRFARPDLHGEEPGHLQPEPGLYLDGERAVRGRSSFRGRHLDRHGRHGRLQRHRDDVRLLQGGLQPRPPTTTPTRRSSPPSTVSSRAAPAARRTTRPGSTRPTTRWRSATGTGARSRASPTVST